MKTGIIVGKLLARPQKKEARGNLEIAEILLSTQNRKGEEEVFNLTCFAKTAEFAVSYLKVNEMVAIEFEPKSFKNQTSDGRVFYNISLTAKSISPLGGGKKQSSARDAAAESIRNNEIPPGAELFDQM